MSGRYLPSLPEVSRETIAVVLGAIAAAFIISHWPTLKAWLKDNYSLPGGMS